MNHTKQTISGLSALLLTASLCGSTLTAAALDPPRYGDFDQDGAVTVTDAQAVLQIYVDGLGGGGRTLTEWELTLADVDFDGAVTVADAQFILTYYVENTLGGKNVSWEEILHPVIALDCARDTLTQMLDGALQHDVDAVLEHSDYFDVVRLMVLLFTGEDYTEEEFRADLEEESEGVGGYTILGGRENPELMAAYNAEMSEVRAEAEQRLAEETDEDARKVLMLELQMLRPLEGLCVFDVEVDEDGETETLQFYVGYREGKWYVDTMMLENYVASLKMSKQEAVNSTAKSVANTFDTALIDLDTAGCKLDCLNGSYCLTGADFEIAEPPVLRADLSESETVRALCWYAAQYLPTLRELPAVAVYIENGVCRYAAAERHFEEGEVWFGCYPNSLVSAAQSDMHDISDALRYAMRYEYDKG